MIEKGLSLIYTSLLQVQSRSSLDNVSREEINAYKRLQGSISNGAPRSQIQTESDLAQAEDRLARMDRFWTSLR